MRYFENSNPVGADYALSVVMASALYKGYYKGEVLRMWAKAVQDSETGEAAREYLTDASDGEIEIVVPQSVPLQEPLVQNCAELTIDRVIADYTVSDATKAHERLVAKEYQWPALPVHLRSLPNCRAMVRHWVRTGYEWTP